MAHRGTKHDALMRAGLNLIQQALSIYDSDLRLAVCNARFQEMFDLPDALVTPGARFEDTIHHLVSRGEYGPVEDVEAAVRDRVQVALAFKPHYMERPRPDGRTIAVEGSPLPQGGWVTVYTDITRAKRQEELLRARSEELSEQLLNHAEELAATNRALNASIAALEEAQRELTEMEARTRLTTEMMPAHIAHVDLDRRYTYSNRRLGQVMPGRPADILGRHIAETMGRQAYAQIEPHLNQAFAGTPSTFEFTDALSSRRIRAAFTPDRSGDRIQGVYILSMDVTEETQARAALQQTRKRELAAQLVSGMAHDFSNLLTIILGSQSRLARMELPKPARPLIEATRAAAERGGTLLERIADMTGHRELRPRPVDLQALLQDLKTLAAPSLPPGITLHLRVSLPPGEVLLDPGPLQDSLLNLILNARDACGEKGRVTLSVRVVQDTWLEFSVTDTGPGFSPAALEHALDPFFTTKGDEGSGLGLSMVYDMTKLAGGEVRLANTYTGARVALRLPLRRPLHDTEPGMVLLVEDSPDLRVTVRDMLTSLGHSVIEAASVDEARALLAEVPDISLVLSDLRLEGGEPGLALAADRPERPIFFMTSLPADDPLRRRAAALAPVLPKPFGADQLAAFLQARTPA